MVPGAYSIHVNGVNKGSSTSSLTPAAFDKIGNDMAGDILEVIAYDRGLSDGVRQKLEVILLTNGTAVHPLVPWLVTWKVPMLTKSQSLLLVAPKYLHFNQSRISKWGNLLL